MCAGTYVMVIRTTWYGGRGDGRVVVVLVDSSGWGSSGLWWGSGVLISVGGYQSSSNGFRV